MAEHPAGQIEDSDTSAEEHGDEGDSEPESERHTGRPVKRQRTQADSEVPSDSESGELASSLATQAQGPARGGGGEAQVPDTLMPVFEDHSQLDSELENFLLMNSSRTGIGLEVLGVGGDALFRGHDMLDINDACKAIDLHGPGARRINLNLSYNWSQPEAKQLADALQRCSHLEYLLLQATE
jgi:hypothetical protein